MQNSHITEFSDLLVTEPDRSKIKTWLQANLAVLQEPVLHYAVMANRGDMITVLLELGAEINLRDTNGRTALYYAVSKDRLDCVKILISHNAAQLRDNNDQSPLHLALSLYDTHPYILHFLLESFSADFDLDEIKSIIHNAALPNPIRCAANLYLIEKMKQLKEITHGVSFGKSRNSVVLFAIADGNFEVLDWLLQHGFSLDVKYEIGIGPVLVASAAGQIAMLTKLVKPKSEEGYGLDLHAVDDIGRNAVLFAISYGQIAMLDVLLKPICEQGFGLTLNVTDKWNYCPVTHAIRSGEIETLAKLVRPLNFGGYGLSLNINIRGYEPISIAVGCNQLDMLRALTTPAEQGGFGLSFNPIVDNVNPIMVAVSRERDKLLAELIKPTNQGGFGLSLAIVNNNGEDPALYAIRCGKINILKKLIAPVSEGGFGLIIAKDNMGIYVAIAYGQGETLAELVKPVDQGGLGLSLHNWTALAAAIQCGQSKIFAELVKPKNLGGYGIPLKCSYYRGHDLVNLAIKSGQKAMLRTLVQPVKQGGYGLGLKGAVECAIQSGQTEILNELIKSTNQGGNGLALPHNAITLAITAQQVDILILLTKTKYEGGFEVITKKKTWSHYRNSCRSVILIKTLLQEEFTQALLQEGYLAAVSCSQSYRPLDNNRFIARCKRLIQVSQKNNDHHITLEARIAMAIISDFFGDYLGAFMDYLEQLLLNKSCEEVLSWVEENINRVPDATALIKTRLTIRYKELVIQNLKDENQPNAEKWLSVLMAHSPGDGTFTEADCQSASGCFHMAFRSYLKLYQDKASHLRQKAGEEIADFIFTGKVILNEDGSLNEKKTLAQQELDDTKLNQHGRDIMLMQERAIMAYEYLHQNNSDHATALRRKLNNVLEGNLGLDNSNNHWGITVVKRFAQYYREKNPALLSEAAYQNSLPAIQAEFSSQRFNYNAGSANQNSNNAPTGPSP